jgi:uroporphyrinogen decarboxylase
VALWRHFPVDDQDPRSLADATLDFQAQFDFDILKVTPASSFCVKDWGVEDAWKGDAEGTREYTHYVIDQPKDWRPAASPVRGWLGAHLKCLASLRERCAEDLPYLQTVFSPLSQAKHLAGEARLLEHLRREPENVLRALEVITQTTVAYVEAARAYGISGIFYAAQLASYQRMDRQGYSRFGEPFDRRVLEAASGLWLNVLHMHGESIMFDLATTYPVQVINWHDRETSPSLAEARRMTQVALCGGLRRQETMVLGDPQSVTREAKSAIKATQGGGALFWEQGWCLSWRAPICAAQPGMRIATLTAQHAARLCLRAKEATRSVT